MNVRMLLWSDAEGAAIREGHNEDKQRWLNGDGEKSKGQTRQEERRAARWRVCLWAGLMILGSLAWLSRPMIAYADFAEPVFHDPIFYSGFYAPISVATGDIDTLILYKIRYQFSVSFQRYAQAEWNLNYTQFKRRRLTNQTVEGKIVT